MTGASLVAQTLKNLPAMQETQVWSLGQENALERDRHPAIVLRPSLGEGLKWLVEIQWESHCIMSMVTTWLLRHIEFPFFCIETPTSPLVSPSIISAKPLAKSWETFSVLPRVLMEASCCSAAQLCPTLWDCMDYSTPGFPVLGHLWEFVQTDVHWVEDAI